MQRSRIAPVAKCSRSDLHQHVYNSVLCLFPIPFFLSSKALIMIVNELENIVLLCKITININGSDSKGNLHFKV